MTEEKGTLKPRPYARLLTMLSDQLIKNHTIALTELAKNSYDADSEWVQIRIGNMQNFEVTKKLTEDEKPFVEIEDCGDGMSLDILKDCWMNPAAPDKFLKRQKKERTRRRRIIQGEKGIGRYAVFQIGKKVDIFTRQRLGENKGDKEIHLSTDLTAYTDELISKKGEESDKPLYFDQLESEYSISDKPKIIQSGEMVIEGNTVNRKNHGILIRITDLNYKWTRRDAKEIRDTLAKLQSPFRKIDFDVGVIFEGEKIKAYGKLNLKTVLDDALIHMKGSVDVNGNCSFTIDDGKSQKDHTINLVENLRYERIEEIKEHFFKDNAIVHKPECGPFNFQFYVYNVGKLDEETKEFVKDHRIYVYRDDFRIYPYGDRDNDWLKLDIYRGLIKAGYYLSNDQLIGYVEISSYNNPGLRDKTSREGLIEQGTAYEDLRILNLSILKYLHTEYQKIVIKPKPRGILDRKNKIYLQTEKVQKKIDKLHNYLTDANQLKAKEILNEVSKEYNKERKIFQEQIDIVEDLAGVGISVDATSHDVMLMMSQTIETSKELKDIVNKKRPDLRTIQWTVSDLAEKIELCYDLLKGIQPLFRSSRRQNQDVKLYDIISTARKYYSSYLDKYNINFNIKEIKPELIIRSSEGILLQIFINLLDNSIFWLHNSGIDKPEIKVIIDGTEESVIFSDNGPGVTDEDVDYIFEAFFSKKGIDGRGLGLYIARELADKFDYDLYYVKDRTTKMLSGANFKIDFKIKQR